MRELLEMGGEVGGVQPFERFAHAPVPGCAHSAGARSS